MQRRTLLIAAGAGAGGLLLLFLACAGSAAYFGWRAAVTPQTPRVYSRPEFQKAVLGLTTSEVRSLLGAPDQILMQGAPAGQPLPEPDWFYSGRTKNPATGKVDRRVQLLIVNDRVVQIHYPYGD